MIGTEPTLGREPQSIAGDSNARTENRGDFEGVLEDLLNADTALSALAGWANPILLNPPPALAEPKIALDGLKAIAPDLPIAPHMGALLESNEFEQVGATAPMNGQPTTEPITPEMPAQAGDAAIASLEQVERPLLGAAVPDLAIEENDAVEQGASVVESDLQNGKGASDLPLSSNDAPLSSGEESVSPVSSARQGETLSSQRFTNSEFVEPTARGLERVSEPRRARLEPAHDHPLRVSAPHGAPQMHTLTQTELAPSVHAAPPDWHAVEQVAQHIERLVYQRERESITVRLDPPELGVIELRVQASGGEVQAWVSAERDLTRQLLQQAQQQLREQLESRGLQLTHFDVGGQNNPHFAQARPFRTPTAQSQTITHPATATDSLSHYDGRWSVWV
ncbi:MAG: hypothetical protein KatS3mg019_1185 [Fimbriimonadales bacterium]|nr:MAG: hypothetical protein KatS3mg019_1185 [Fimbriimonadales bacterium]